MNNKWNIDIKKSLDYIEKHLCDDLKINSIARYCYMSNFHFQRVFGIICGMSVGDYIRRRKLSLAAIDLFYGKETVIEVSIKYGYNNPSSFARAFKKFHSIYPSFVKKQETPLKVFDKIKLEEKMVTDKELSFEFNIERRKQKLLIGYKKRFKGVTFGEERRVQEKEFFETTRAKQWLIRGMSCEYHIDYCAITNVNDSGYDFYIAAEVDEDDICDMFNPSVTGVDFMNKMGFEKIIIPESFYAVFKTKNQRKPIVEYMKLRGVIANCTLLSDFVINNTPELTAIHWRPNGTVENRYIEILLPIKSKLTNTDII